MSKVEYGYCLCDGPPVHPRPDDLVSQENCVQCPRCSGSWVWQFSVEELFLSPSDLGLRDLHRSEGFSVLQLLYEIDKVPRIRSAISDDHSMTAKSAHIELKSIKKWWEKVKDHWLDGKLFLVTHVGLAQNEIEAWMDINLVVPYFQNKLDAPISLEEIKLTTVQYRLRGEID